MTIGIGGKTIDEALASLSDMTAGAVPIGKDEHLQRIARAQAFMQAQGIAAIYINAGANLTYFTGTKWYASERMVGAILPAQGAIEYIAPRLKRAR
jgi:Xaa-Pro dipeptidase